MCTFNRGAIITPVLLQLLKREGGERHHFPPLSNINHTNITPIAMTFSWARQKRIFLHFHLRALRSQCIQKVAAEEEEQNN
jgi:hypothetical protein